ncbi:MAG: VTT domain-containing protein [Colwellia sp.]|nr:VTT domain-containing protein [Colwellia sp.]
MLKNQTTLFLFLSIFVGLAVGFSLLFSLDALQNESLQLWLQGFIPQNTLGFFIALAILSLLTGIGLPRQVAAFSGGYVFGTLYGTLLATSAATLGCLITLYIAKTFFRQRVLSTYPAKLNHVTHFFEKHTFSKALIIRLLPAGSNFLTNVLAGIANVKVAPYVTGTCIGFVPQMLIFSLLGAGVKVGEQQQIILSICLFGIALVFGYLLYSKENNLIKNNTV